MNKYEELFLDLINFCDFELCKDKNGYWLYDLQGANLGDIESDRFSNASDILDRMEIYIGDYIIDNLIDNDFCGNYPIIEIEWNTWEDILDYMLEHLDDYKNTSAEHYMTFLDLICRNYDKVNLDNLGIVEE